MAPSPAQQDDDKSSGTETMNDTFKLESPESFEFEMIEELPELTFQKVTSEPLWQDDKIKNRLDIENFMTKSVGTRIYASPEQWQADQTKFDQRADIFSLGIIYLLLFHPMSTYMEQSQLINESKEGKIPAQMEKELPDISKIIKRMLSVNPAERPSLDVISRSLKLPLEMSTDLTGSLYSKKENSASWRKKHFKLIEGKLYLFNRDEDKKAEVVYDLSEWKVQMKDTESDQKQSCKNQSRSQMKKVESEGTKTSDKENDQKQRKQHEIITIENSIQLGCSFRGESTNETLELFQKLSRSVQSF